MGSREGDPVDSTSLLNVERRERLLSELRRRGVVRVADLATLLDVSPVTIRRDLTVLARQNQLTKVHGGAVLPQQERVRKPDPNTRLKLGMVVPTLDFFWPQVITGARTAAAMLGVDLRLRASNYDALEDRRQIDQILAADHLDGLLLAPGVDDDLNHLAALSLPCVLVERAAPAWGPGERPLESVRNDHDAGVEAAVRHFVEQGHERIAVVSTPLSPNVRHVENGFRRACEVLGLRPGPVFESTLRADQRRAAHILDQCLALGVTAVLIHSDPDALTFVRQAASAGIDVPGDLAVISYDDELADSGDPPLTAVRPVQGQIGRTAVEVLVSRLTEGRRRPATRVQLVPELIIRSSSVVQRR